MPLNRKSIADADRISDRIVDMVNEEVGRGTNPIAMWAGQIMALKSFMRTAPRGKLPQEFSLVEMAIDMALISMAGGSGPVT